MLAPKVAAFTGATGYRLSGIATNGAPTNTAQSVVLRRGQAGPTLTAGAWLAPPTGLALTRTGGSWTGVAGATVHGVELRQGQTGVLNVSVFDGAETVTLPDLITLPSGELTAVVQAIGATGLDVTEFSLDADRDKLDRVSSQGAAID
jgi:hypothetical protein